MANLLAVKPLKALLHEAEDEGGSGLKRALGPVNLITLGIGAIIGAGIFVLTGTAAAQFAGPAIVLSFVVAGIRLRLRGSLLCGVRVDDPDCGLGVHVRLCDAGRAGGVDHRLGAGAWNMRSARRQWPSAGAAT